MRHYDEMEEAFDLIGGSGTGVRALVGSKLTRTRVS